MKDLIFLMHFYKTTYISDCEEPSSLMPSVAEKFPFPEVLSKRAKDCWILGRDLERRMVLLKMWCFILSWEYASSIYLAYNDSMIG